MPQETGQGFGRGGERAVRLAEGIGEAPESSAIYPFAVKLKHLPMSADERPEPWYGPDRGM
ncbi:hypothetical protein SNOUR_37125 [Streptomyces noursei ATCC 11455]|nr:hypothetical protein SNOUR_37125 [Streptomyces noursei ATCC 11455]